jgi:hypothetical protein
MEIAGFFLTLVWKGTKFGYKVCQASEEASPLFLLSRGLQRDIVYAEHCWDNSYNTIKKFRPEQVWISNVITDAKKAKKAFDGSLKYAGDDETAINQAKFVLWYAEKVASMQSSLSTAHACLLQAINLMHQLCVQEGGPLQLKPSIPSQRASSQPAPPLARDMQSGTLPTGLIQLAPSLSGDIASASHPVELAPLLETEDPISF